MGTQTQTQKGLSDGIVEPGTERGDVLGFSDKEFVAGLSYLWVKGPDVYVSAVAVYQPGKGTFSRFVHGLLEKGWTVKVPTPLGRMIAILEHLGFKHGAEHDDATGETVDVWTKRPPEGCQTAPTNPAGSRPSELLEP